MSRLLFYCKICSQPHKLLNFVPRINISSYIELNRIELGVLRCVALRCGVLCCVVLCCVARCVVLCVVTLFFRLISNWESLFYLPRGFCRRTYLYYR